MTVFKYMARCKFLRSNKVCKSLLVLLLFIPCGEVFSQEKSQAILLAKSSFESLASNIKGAIKQTSAQYADDGQIVAWNEAYVQPSDNCIEFYSFYRSDAGKFERTASEALFGEKLYLVSSKGLFLPRHIDNTDGGNFVNNVLVVLTLQGFAKPRLDSAQKMMDSPGIDSSPMLLAKAYDTRRLLDVAEIIKKGEFSFQESGRQYVVMVEKTGLLANVKIFDRDHLRLQIMNEEIPKFHIEPPLQSFIDKDGRESYYQPTNFAALHVTTSSLGLVYNKTPDGYFVKAVAPGSPLSKTDVKIGDQLLSVDNTEVKQLDDDSFKKLCSSADTLKLKIKHPSGEINEYNLQKSLPSTW